ncbi:hypothetical protein BDV93DRAFT_526749 [Ceratobasidium sp. AG-I]|nr:hypothetical protein BDV93DRAFT_526749 [Ceratobasidium sp. AG-I]
MGKNKRRKKVQTTPAPSVDPSAPPGSSYDAKFDSVPLIDGSDFPWPGKKTLPFIADKTLHGDYIAVLDTFPE